MKLEFDIKVKDDGWFVRFLRRFGKPEGRYWWRLPLGFRVRENYQGINMMDTIRRCRNETR